MVTARAPPPPCRSRPCTERVAAGSRRWPTGARWCRAGSPLAEPPEGLVDSLGQPAPAAPEQGHPWPGTGGSTREGANRLPDQLRLAASSAGRRLLERPLEIVRQVHGRLLHAIHATIHE